MSLSINILYYSLLICNISASLNKTFSKILIFKFNMYTIIYRLSLWCVKFNSFPSFCMIPVNSNTFPGIPVTLCSCGSPTLITNANCYYLLILLLYVITLLYLWCTLTSPPRLYNLQQTFSPFSILPGSH